MADAILRGSKRGVMRSLCTGSKEVSRAGQGRAYCTGFGHVGLPSTKGREESNAEQGVLRRLASLELQFEAVMLLAQGAQLLLHLLILAHQGSLHQPPTKRLALS